MSVGISYDEKQSDGSMTRIYITEEEDPLAPLTFDDKKAAKDFLRENHVENFKGFIFDELPIAQA
jgi:hypothetical protein